MRNRKEKGRLLLVFLLAIMVSVLLLFCRVIGYALIYHILLNKTVLAVLGVLLIAVVAICLVKGTKKK